MRGMLFDWSKVRRRHRQVANRSTNCFAPTLAKCYGTDLQTAAYENIVSKKTNTPKQVICAYIYHLHRNYTAV